MIPDANISRNWIGGRESNRNLLLSGSLATPGSHHNIELLSHSPVPQPGPLEAQRMSADLVERPEGEGRCSTSTSQACCIISSISSITCERQAQMRSECWEGLVSVTSVPPPPALR